MRNGIKIINGRSFHDVIIVSDYRFIASYKRHRISIVKTDKGEYDITVTAKDGCNVVETIAKFNSMNEAIEDAIDGALLN